MLKNEFQKLNIKICPKRINMKYYVKENIEQLLPRDQDLFKLNIVKKYVNMTQI